MLETSKEYWFVRQQSTTEMNIKWERKNPTPVMATLKKRQAYWAKEKEARNLHRKTYDEGRAKLKAAGYDRQRDFPITKEKQAREYADMVTKRTGVEMSVSRGFYLNMGI